MISSRHILPGLLILAGMGLLILSVAVDFVGLSGKGFGPKQILIALVGGAVIVLGLVLVTPIGRRIQEGLASFERTDLPPRTRAIRLVIASLWFGIVAGIIEGIGFLILQRFGFSTRVSLEILWVAPIFNAILFGILGLIAGAITGLLPRLPITLATVFLLTLLALVDWLELAVGIPEIGVHPFARILLAAGVAVVFIQWFKGHDEAAFRFWQKSLPAIAVITLAILVAVQGGQWIQERNAVSNLTEADANSPDILVVVADTLRADHMSSYGYERNTSPNIDHIASEGVLFENVFATSSWTLSSHASMVTGLYNHDHNVTWKTPKEMFNVSTPTIAETLKERGYRTGAFSANVLWFTREHGFGRGFITFEDYFRPQIEAVLHTLYGRRIDEAIISRIWHDTPTRKWAPDINDSLLNWMEADRDKPFFAFVNYFDVHDPYLPPQPYRSIYSGDDSLAGKFSGEIGSIDPDLNPEETQAKIDAYDGAIVYLDEHIGKLMSEIESRGLSDNLLVIITSDHGEAFGEHGTFRHANSVYREEIYVPMIVWQPGQVPAGIRVKQAVTNAAIPATIMDMLGSDDSNLYNGPSLRQLWENNDPQAEWPFPLAEMIQRSWLPEKAPLSKGSARSLASSEWHYIEHETLGTELYDWDDDPLQSQDLSDSAEGQTVIDLFKRSLDTLLARNP